MINVRLVDMGPSPAEVTAAVSSAASTAAAAHLQITCMEFFYTFLSLLLSVYDSTSDFMVAIETSISKKRQTLYGDVIIYENQIGTIMVVLVYAAGMRLAWFELSDRIASPVRRGLVSVVIALPAHLMLPFYKIWFLVDIVRLKSCSGAGRRGAARNIGVLQQKLRSIQLIEAQWESLPQLILTSAKIGLANRLTVLELTSMLTSSMSMGVVVINSVSFLRQKGGFAPISLLMRLPLSLLASSAIWATVITSTMFAVEAERDGVFAPASKDPSVKTPGIFIPAVLIPVILLVLSLVSIPDFTLLFLPLRLSYLSVLSQPITRLHLALSFLFTSGLFLVDFGASLYFIRRDNFPTDAADDLFLPDSHISPTCSDYDDPGESLVLAEHIANRGADALPTNASAAVSSWVCLLMARSYNVKVGKGRLMWIQFHEVMAVFVSISYITAITFIQIFRKRDGYKLALSFYRVMVFEKAAEAAHRLQRVVDVEEVLERLESLHETLKSRLLEQFPVNSGGVAVTNFNCSKYIPELVCFPFCQNQDRRETDPAGSPLPSSSSRSTSCFRRRKSTSSSNALDESVDPTPQEVSTSLEILVDTLGRINTLLLSVGERLDTSLLESLNKILAKEPAAARPQERRPDSVLSQTTLFLFSFVVVLLSFLYFFFLVPNCPDGMNHFLPIRGYCYSYIKTDTKDASFSFDEARRFCERHDAILVEIRTKEELTSITEQLKHMPLTGFFWTYLTKLEPSPFAPNISDAHLYPFQWNHSKEIPTFTIPWVKGQPSRKQPPERPEKCTVVELRRGGGLGGAVSAGAGVQGGSLWFYDQNCGGASAFMCKKSFRFNITEAEPVEHEDCPEKFRDLKPFGDTCYHVEGHKSTWAQAKRACEEGGGQLATFESEEAWLRIREEWYKKGGNGWISGRSVCVDGRRQFRWIGGRNVTLDFGWWRGQPGGVPCRPEDDDDDDKAACVRVAANKYTAEFGWWPNRCSKIQSFLCQIPKTKKRKRDGG